MTRTPIASLLLLSLAACGGGDTDGKSTTKLDAVEVQPGSVSDSMIILDDATSDGTAVDNSVPGDESKKDSAKTDNADADDKDTDEGAEAVNPETVDIPVAKRAITPDSAVKKGE